MSARGGKAYRRQVPSFLTARSDDPAAERLLDEYFASRELGFTTGPGGYRVVRPDPAWFIPPAGVFLVMRDDTDEPVGCGGVRRIGDLDGRATFEVKHVWIQERARGRGWSRLLMAELETRAADLGARQVVLDTNRTLDAAQHLYRTSGYRAVPAYNSNPNATDWFAKLLE